MPVRTLLFPAPGSFGSDHLLVGSDDFTTTLHDVKDIKSKHTSVAVGMLFERDGWVLDAAISGDGRILATAYVYG